MIAERLKGLIEEQEEPCMEEGKIPAAPIIFKPLKQWMTLKQKPWLVRDIVRCGQSMVLYGASGTLKTFFALDLALAVTHGKKFLDTFATRPARVAYIYSEAPEGGPQRIEAWMKKKGVKELSDNFFYTTARLQLVSPESIEVLKDGLISSMGEFPELVIIDTLSKNFGGDENGSEMQKFTASVEQLRQDTGATIIIIHHVGKDGTKEERGHSSLRADVDTSIKLTRDKQTKIVTFESQKVKDEADGETIQLKPEIIMLRTIDDEFTGSEDISSIVLVPLTERQKMEAEQEYKLQQNLKLLSQLLRQSLGGTEWRARSGVKAAIFAMIKDRLVDADLVSKGEKHLDPYAITEEGRKYYEEWTRTNK